MNHSSRAVAGALGALLLATTPLAQSDAAARAAQAGNAFGCDLYRALRNEKGNLFFSPYSVAVALTMTRAGAVGDTAAEMDRVLHLDGDAGPWHHALTTALRPRKVKTWIDRERRAVDAYELHVANRLFGDRHVTFETAFQDGLKDSFGAPMERVDFSDPASVRARINAWVAQQTRDRIRDIVPEGLPSADTCLALANAIHFKASWMHAFSKRRTADAAFTTAAGETIQLPMMRNVESHRYADIGDAQVLELPYRGRDTAMIIVLPRTADGLPALERKLDAKTFDGWIGKLANERVDVRLPRFSCESSFDLAQTLPAMGMKRAFTPTADFSGMTQHEALMIGPVLHKAFIEVDEAGTEAAAATVVMMKRSGDGPREPIAFTADRPFLFAIRHRTTGCVLFLGRFADPRS